MKRQILGLCPVNMFAGRTGRAGREGKAVTFFTDEDAPYLKMCVYQCYSTVLTNRLAGSQMSFFNLDLPCLSGSFGYLNPPKRSENKWARLNVPIPLIQLGRRDAVKKRFALYTKLDC